MKNILVINGHVFYPFAEGKLNQTMFENIVETIHPHCELKTTVIDKGYVVEEEIEKFKWADIIIFQMPIYWYSFPGKLKTYIDKVYQHGIFYTASEEYGRGGLFTDKKYMYSLTCGTPKDSFLGDPNSFLEGKSLDEVIFAMHKVQEYCGMTRLKTFCCYNAMGSPDIDQLVSDIKMHIQKELHI